MASMNFNIKPIFSFKKKKKERKLKSSSRTIFIHIPKTAGSLIRKNIINSEGTHLIQKHKPDKPILDLDNKKFDDFFIFTSIRNPWDRLISAFFHLLDPDADISDEYRELIKKFKDNFELFVKELEHDPELQNIIYLKPQIYWLKKYGKRKIDFIIRYEHLLEDLQKLSKIININFEITKKINAGKHKHYSEYYDEVTKKIVEKIYEEDIKILGYKFEGGPEKVTGNNIDNN